MAQTFYFYDVETSGLNPREARIMQFAGQRTDMNLTPIGKPHNFFIRLTNDVVPDPSSVLITGITPQKTLADGITEAAFLKIFYKDIATPDTVFSGYNIVRFDDEFMRYLHYRNFYDPYQWQYKDGRSRWDLLDVARMTRALRPEGIGWPFDAKGKATNRLELITSVNKIEHHGAHDALSDVKAVIEVAKLIKQKQPKLFGFLLSKRDKQKVAELVESGQPFVYTSGKYQSEYEKTTIAVMLAKHPKRSGALVYDLRHDPTEFAKLTPKELTEAWRRRKDDLGPQLPVKDLLYNRCPAVAPLNVLDEASQQRLRLTTALIKDHHKKLIGQKTFAKQVLKALGLLDEQQQLRFQQEQRSVDAQLYDGFFGGSDKQNMQSVHLTNPDTLAALASKFQDKRLKALLPLYKARNFPKALSADEYRAWEQHRSQYLLSGEENRLSGYFNKINELQQMPTTTDEQQYILEDLQLYGESIIPES